MDNIQNLQIKAKKISALDTFPSNYNLNQKNNNYLLLSCLEDNNTRKNYKISLEQIINYIYNQVSESVTSDNDTNINTIKNELIQIINSHHASHTITYNLTNVINDNENPNMIIGSNPVSLSFTNAPGYIMPDTITVTGASYEYNQINKTINLLNITDDVVITINATDKIVCVLTSRYADDNHIISIESDNDEFIVNDRFNIKLISNNLNYKLPSKLNCEGCSIISYNSLTGNATLICTGTNEFMTISGDPEDNTPYIFSYGIESDTNIFTLSNNTIVDINWNNLSNLPYTIHTNGTCGFNFEVGINWDSAVDVVGENVWIIMPSKYFETPNIIIDDDNKYNFIDIFGNAFFSIKDVITLYNNDIEYTLFNISNNGVTGTQKFKQTETDNYIEDTMRGAKAYTDSKLGDIGNIDVKSYIDLALNEIMGEDWTQCSIKVKDIVNELSLDGNNNFDTVVDKIRDDFTYGDTGNQTTDIKHYIDGKVADCVNNGTTISSEGVLMLG